MDTSSSPSGLTVGFIVDGNRRWAKKEGLLNPIKGHEAGYRKIEDVMTWLPELGVSTAYFYTLSTENWNRDPEEVSGLLSLMTRVLEKEVGRLVERGVRLKIIGDRARFSPEMQVLMSNAEEATRFGEKVTAIFALSYGSRSEIVDAATRIASDGLSGPITEERFGDYLWTAGLPDPDLIVRTSGEKRLSNFLLWQSAYAELFFIDTLWPDLTREELTSLMEEYGKRNRRFGK